MAERAVCPDHDAPIQFVWDLFAHEVEEAIVLASRDAGKTLALAMLHAANHYWKPGYATTHFGSVENQTKRAYKHFHAMLERPMMRPLVDVPGKKSTSFRSGGDIEILPGTEAQTQGPHGNIVSWDELESGERTPYENARGIPSQDAEGHPGQFVTTSTRRKKGGLMQQALDDAPNRGARVYEFCVWDTVRAREKVRRRCKHSDEAHRDPQASAEVKACTVPIARYIKGLNFKKADGWRSLADVMATWRRMALDTFETQVLNLRPEGQALIYPRFDVENITEAAEYVPGETLLVAYDAGFADDTWIGLVQLRDGAFWLFDELNGSRRSERYWVRELVKRVIGLDDYEGPDFEAWKKIWETQRGYPRPWPHVWPHASGDFTPSAEHMRRELKEHGIAASGRKQVRHDIVEGQNVFRQAIYEESEAKRRVFVHPRCEVFIRAMQSYGARELPDGTYDEKPDTAPSNHRWSHPCDGMRYLVYRWRREVGLGT